MGKAFLKTKRRTAIPTATKRPIARELGDAIRDDTVTEAAPDSVGPVGSTHAEDGAADISVALQNPEGYDRLPRVVYINSIRALRPGLR